MSQAQLQIENSNRPALVKKGRNLIMMKEGFEGLRGEICCDDECHRNIFFRSGLRLLRRRFLLELKSQDSLTVPARLRQQVAKAKSVLDHCAPLDRTKR